jgi:hypothetical protein
MLVDASSSAERWVVRDLMVGETRRRKICHLGIGLQIRDVKQAIFFGRGEREDIYMRKAISDIYKQADKGQDSQKMGV